MTDSEKKAWEEAAATPLGRYPETVFYTMAKPRDYNSNMPEEDTYEDNNFTRYLQRILNVQNEEVFTDLVLHNYTDRLKMQISDEHFPDVMALTDLHFLKELVEDDALADLTEVYEQCTSERIKEMYATAGSDFLDPFIFDGKLMALPSMPIDQGPYMIWLRKDWMDKLGLEEPQNWDEVYSIIEKFAAENPGDHPKGNIGLGFSLDGLMRGSIHPIMGSQNSFADVWYPDDSRRIKKGFVQKETKDALRTLHDLYERGILDRNFMLRETNNVISLIDSGRCGAVGGGWWMPYICLQESYEKQGAEWEPYIFPGTDGKIHSYTTDLFIDCVVVRKNYEHPEIVPKILTALYDHARYEGKDTAPEVEEYFRIGVGEAATPLGLDIDYKNSVFRTTTRIEAVWNGELDYEELSLIERVSYENCNAYKNKENRNGKAWADFCGRITAVNKISKYPIEYLDHSFFNVTPDTPKKLQKLENETFIKIITGEQDIEEFDDFVRQWYENGGAELEEEVNQVARKDS